MIQKLFTKLILFIILFIFVQVDALELPVPVFKNAEYSNGVYKANYGNHIYCHLEYATKNIDNQTETDLVEQLSKSFLKFTKNDLNKVKTPLFQDKTVKIKITNQIYVSRSLLKSYSAIGSIKIDTLGLEQFEFYSCCLVSKEASVEKTLDCAYLEIEPRKTTTPSSKAEYDQEVSILEFFGFTFFFFMTMLGLFFCFKKTTNDDTLKSTPQTQLTTVQPYTVSGSVNETTSNQDVVTTQTGISFCQFISRQSCGLGKKQMYFEKYDVDGNDYPPSYDECTVFDKANHKY